MLPSGLATAPSKRSGSGRDYALRHNPPLEQVETEFLDPDQWFAPFIFYFWNGELAATDIGGQVTEMSRKGLNPGYIHERGTQPAQTWISEVWFDKFHDGLQASAAAGTFFTYTAGDPCVPERAMLEHNPELVPQSLRWRTGEIAGGERFVLTNALFSVAGNWLSK